MSRQLSGLRLMRLHRRWLLCGVFVLSQFNLALAENPTIGKGMGVANGAEIPTPTPAASLVSAASSTTNLDAAESVDQFTIVFDAAISRFETAAFAEAADHFFRLQKLKQDFGWENLPLLSFELIRRIDHFLGEQDTSRARFLLNNAIELSPTDARVYFAALRYPHLVSWNQYSNFFIEIFHHGAQQLRAVASAAMNILLLALVSSTTAMFVVLMIQMVRHFGDLSDYVRHYLPFRFQKASSLLVLVVGIGSLALGLLPALACWALLLSFHVRVCRWFGAIAGSLILAWTFAMPVLDVVGVNLRTPLNQAYENLNNSTFVRGDREAVLAAGATNNMDGLLQFAIAQMYIHDRQYAPARDVLTKMVSLPGLPSSVAQAAWVNLGVCEFMLKNFTVAREHLLRAELGGEASFESFFNRAQVEMALLNTEAYREYYARAATADFPRLLALGEGGKETNFLVPARLPLSLLYATLLHSQVDRMGNPLLGKRSDALLRSMLIKGSFSSSLTCGFLTLLLGAYARVRKVKRRVSWVLERPSTRCSRVWAIIPAGLYAAGDQPVRGWVCMTVMLVATLAACGSPVTMFQVLPDGVFTPSTLLIFAGVLLGIVTCASTLRTARTEKLEVAHSLDTFASRSHGGSRQ